MPAAISPTIATAATTEMALWELTQRRVVLTMPALLGIDENITDGPIPDEEGEMTRCRAEALQTLAGC